jgi:hypothetical protein
LQRKIGGNIIELNAKDLPGYTLGRREERNMSLLATSEQTEKDVAKKRATPQRNDEAVRLRKDVTAKARIAAAFAGVSILDYLSDLLDPILTRAINDAHAKMNREQARAKKGEPPP